MKNDIEIYSTYNERKSVVAERFISTLKNKIYNVCIDKLDEIANKYNSTYHRKIKMKPADINLSMYINFNKEDNKDSPKFKIGNDLKISKYKNIFVKGYAPNSSEEVFVIKKLKNLCHDICY